MEYEKSYGLNMAKRKPDFSRCAAEVHNQGRWPGYHQCRSKAKYDPDKNGKPTTCGVHCEAAVARRKAISNEKEKKSSREWSYKWYGQRFYNALKKIADGDNNPRELAREMVALIDRD